MILIPGQVLVERYRVIGLLGQGGMAAVYCAHDRVLDRLVAIKQMRPDPSASEEAIEQARQQFLREAQVLATLDHPNLPRVTDYFTRDSVEYLAMDYVEGQSLIELVQKHGAGLLDSQVLDWADQLLAALDYIHRHGVIHRDVKPANIRLTPDGRIFLVDFGLVKLFDPSNPKTATIMHGLGTPEYAPPEQYDSRLGHTDPRSDVYALGATMYHLLTGQAPATATQRISDPGSFRRPRALRSNISTDIERAILRAMELQRAQRFDNAAEMRAALTLARRQMQPVDEGGQTQRLPNWRAAGRGPLVRRAAPLLIFVVLLAGGVIGLARGDVPTSVSSHTPTFTQTPSATRRSTTAAPTASSTPRKQSTLNSSIDNALLDDGRTRVPRSPTATRTRRISLTATHTPTITNTPTDTPTSTFTPKDPKPSATQQPSPVPPTTQPPPSDTPETPVTRTARPTPVDTASDVTLTP